MTMAEAKKAADTKVGLYTRLSKILADIGNVPKSGFNDHFKYNYVMESDLADVIRPLLAKNGIGLIYDCIEATDHSFVNDKGKTVNMVRVKVAITLGVEDAEGNLLCERTGHCFGQAADNGDKAIYKAMTGAVKYWLYKTFLVSTGDDPEQATDEDKEAAKVDPEVALRTEHWTVYQADVAAMDACRDLAGLEAYVVVHKPRMQKSVYKGNYATYINGRRKALSPPEERKAA
jgi:hypothetical protein